jgi:tRNA threonylcarbamoyladenosine biosynthesis protein TsaE
MNVETYKSESAAKTREIGEMLSRRLRPGDLVTLSGPLGAGKTTLVQGIAQGLGTVEDVTSPTFVLIIEHTGRIPLLHLDAYRLEGKCYDVIRDAGVTDLLERQDAVKVAEWPECVIDFLPTANFAITLNPGDTASERVIEVATPQQ